MNKIIMLLLFCLLTVDTASARRHHHHRGGGLICGAVQMSHFGITDQRYRLARAWASFRRVSAQVGAVVVSSRRGRDSGGGPGGHVTRIVATTGSPCEAIVSDSNRGGRPYRRNICRNQIAIVMP